MTGKPPSDAGNGTAGKPPPIRDQLAKPLPKRFYKSVSVGEGAFFQILLDSRVVKTPGKRALALPAKPLAEAIAAEWAAQGEFIDPASMPLTRFSNTAIDAVSETLEDVAGDIVAFAGSDLVCYRAVEEELAALQARHWDPVVAWAREALKAHFTVTTGVIPVEQPNPSLFAFSAALEPHEAFRLTGLHVLTTLTGSALLALAHARGFLGREEVWAAAHVDEDYQIRLWGKDEEAARRRENRRADFDAACRLLSLLV